MASESVGRQIISTACHLRQLLEEHPEEDHVWVHRRSLVKLLEGLENLGELVDLLVAEQTKVLDEKEPV